MTKKYYGVWHKEREKWFCVSQHDSNPNLLWRSSVGIKKIINRIALWNNLDKINLLVKRWNPKYWEIREFTPADALLAKCGKNG